MVCAYWPQQGLLARPAQFAGGDYPTIILNGDADPITPIEQSYRIMDNLQNGYMVAMQGGPHVIWGRGLACPDQSVADLMIDGTLPEAPEQVCTQHLIASYTPAYPDRPRRCRQSAGRGTGAYDRALPILGPV